MDEDTPDLTGARQLQRLLDRLPASTATLADHLDVSKNTVESYRTRLEDVHGVELEYDRSENEWRRVGANDSPDDDPDGGTPDNPDPSDLTDRERHIVRQLQTGATAEEIAAELDESPAVVPTYLDTIEAKGWSLYHDDTADRYELVDDDHLVRSSEHKGTRTRKANRWWERTHNRLQRNYKRLDDVPDTGDCGGGADESIVFELSDLHIGDRIRRPSDNLEVYNTEIAVGKAEYAAREAIDFADDRAREYDAGWILFGGDMVTCEAIYEGQWEDLDSFLDQQLNAAADAGLRVVSAFAQCFDTVNIICQTGNHGQLRASGSSRQANADLLFYHRLRNIIGVIQEYGDRLQNVRQSIGEPGRFYDFTLRGGAVTGHLRHGDDDRAQNDTAAAQRDWRGRALTHDFDVAWIGHHHKFRRFEVDSRDVFVTSAPKPPGDYAEKLGAGGAAAMDSEAVNRKIAVAHGVNDDGVTDSRIIDTRDYSAAYVPGRGELGLPAPDPVPGAIGPDATPPCDN